MATATVSGTSVTFSNSTAAANLTTSIYESNTSSSYLTAFDVLAASGGGAKTTVYSVDDGVKSTSVTTNTGFSTYNTDLLFADQKGSAYAETTLLGAKFWIGTDSKIYYDASALAGQINHLGVGEKLTDSFQYTIKMSNGTLSVGTLTVDLKGINDAVVITSGTQGATTNEDATTASTGTIAFKDADTNDIHTATFAAAATNTTALGSFSLGAVNETHVAGNDAVGSVGWSYTVDNSAANYLGRTESATETYNVTVKDGHGGDAIQAVTVTIIGVNDAVSIVAGSTTASGSASEDASSAVTGSIAFTDPDFTDTHTADVSAHGDNANVGTFSLGSVSEDGSTAGGSVGWSYTVDNAAANHLAVGESAVDRFDVTIGDGLTSATQTVEVTVTGVNDEVAITSTAFSVQTDEDAVPAVGTGTGSATVDPSGTITFTDPDWSDVHHASFAADESNDTALGTFALGSVSESATDADGSVGWTYTVDNDAATYLRAGESVTEVYNVTIADEHGSSKTQAVTVTINGVNDAATIGVGGTSEDTSVTESGYNVAGDFTAGGKLDISDLDHGENVLRSTSTGDFAKTYGTFHVAADGTWTYDLNDGAANALAAGVTEHDSITVTSYDGTASHTITVDIHGTNDAPTVGDAITDTSAEGSASHTVDLLAGASDADDGAVLSVTNLTYTVDGTTVAGLPAGFSLSGATLTVDPTNAAFNHLGVGESTTLVISYSVADEYIATVPQTATITVTGTNDAPVITGGDTASYSINENATGVVATLAATDPDTNDVKTWSLLAGDDSALFTIDSSTGKLSLNTAQDYENPLHAGNTLTVQVQVSDGHTGGTDVQTVTVHINDVNEVVYITAPTNHVAAPVGADPNNNDSLTGTNPVVTGNVTGANGDGNITGNGSDQNLDGGNGNDTIYGGGGNDNISGGNDNDHLYGQAGNDTIAGGNNDDLIYGGSGNDNPITGGNGNDTIYGGDGNDTIDGGNNDDLIVGGYGADNLTGGGGIDTFKFVSLADSGDTITDFASGTDKINVTGLGFTSFSTTQSNANGLWQVADVNGGFFVYGDTDGNVNTYEFTFHVNTGLAAGDFIGI